MTTVLILMDFQNAILANLTEEKRDEVVANAEKLLSYARLLHIPIVFVKVCFREGYPEISERNKAFAAIKEKGINYLVDGTEGCEFHPMMKPRSNEIVISKRRFGAFSGSDLSCLLRGMRAEHVVLAGVSTSGCVLSTVRVAADEDYRITVVADCCADRDEEVHAMLIDRVFPRQCTITQHEQLISEWKAQSAHFKTYSFGNGGRGRLGLGHSEHRNEPTEIEALNSLAIRKLCIGGNHSAALTQGNAVFTWGHGGCGQLGHGNEDDQLRPVLVRTLHDQCIVDLDAGFDHTMFLSKEGRLFVCGLGECGRVGNGEENMEMTPIEPPIFASRGIRIKKMAAGYKHSLALTVDGDLYSFGNGGCGQLGHGNTDDCLIPTRVTTFDTLLGDGDTRDHIVQIAAGYYHSVVLTESGRVFTFGTSHKGQLGHGNNTENQLVPREMRFTNEHKVKFIAAGSNHTLLVTTDNKLYTCGHGQYGQLGHGTTEDIHEPKLVTALANMHVVQIAAGVSHTIVLTADNRVFVFGCGEFGRLGLGDALNYSTPTELTWLVNARKSNPNLTVLQIGAGYNHSAIAVSERRLA